jgi:hypothetical protein
MKSIEPPRPGEALRLKEDGKPFFGFVWEAAGHPGFYHASVFDTLDDGAMIETKTVRPMRWSLNDDFSLLRFVGFVSPTVVARLATPLGWEGFT